MNDQLSVTMFWSGMFIAGVPVIIGAVIVVVLLVRRRRSRTREPG